MKSSNLRILYILVTILTIKVFSGPPNSYCLNNCQKCQQQNPKICTHQGQNCQWGFHDKHQDGKCVSLPFIEVFYDKIGNKSTQSFKHQLNVWNDEVKISKCLLKTQEFYDQIQIYGPFMSMSSIQRTFELEQNYDVYSISFNLIRDQWIPIKDFLSVEVSSFQRVLLSKQIRYQAKSDFKGIKYELSCGTKRVYIEKYTFLINNQDSKVNNRLTLSFNSFLIDSMWGITNLKILSGCNHFLIYNPSTNQCDRCQNGFFLVNRTLNEQIGCLSCSNLCKRCQSQIKCTQCYDPAFLQEGQCILESKNFTEIQLSSSNDQHERKCSNYSFLLGTSQIKLQKFFLKTQLKNHLTPFSLSFRLFYNYKLWQQSQNWAIKVKIQNQYWYLSKQNMTSKVSDVCHNMKGNRISTVIIKIDNIIVKQEKLFVSFELQNKSNFKNHDDQIDFGISNLYLIQKKDPEQQRRQQLAQNNRENVIKLEKLFENKDQDSLIKADIQLGKLAQSKEKPSTRSKDFKFLLSSSSIHETPIRQGKNPIIPQELHEISQSGNKIKISSSIQQKQSPKQQTTPSSQSLNNKTQNSKASKQKPQYIITSVPQTNQKQSGIHLTINYLQNCTYINPRISIDNLKPDQYKLQSYNVSQNTLNMFVAVNKSFTNCLVTVTNKSQDQNDRINKTVNRMLAESDQKLIAKVTVERYDYVSSRHVSYISHFSKFFHFFAYVGFISIIMAVILGIGVIAEQNIITLQTLFFHTLIASQILPLSFTNVLSGLKIIQNFNFFMDFIKNTSIIDVNGNSNFNNQMLTIIIISLFYFAWLLCVIILKSVAKGLSFVSQNSGIEKLLNKIVDRKVNFIDQIWRYQYLAVFWLCLNQFKHYYHLNRNNWHNIFNQVTAVTFFAIFVLWPVFVFYYTRKLYYEAEYSTFIQCFEDIFYKKIPIYHLPSRNHRVIYPFFKNCKYLSLIVLIVFETRPELITAIMIALNVMEIFYISKAKIYADERYKQLRMIENGIMILIEACMLLMITLSSTLSTELFVILGYVLSGVSVLVILNSFIRMLYLSREKYQNLISILFEEMPQELENKLKNIQNYN